MFFFLFFLAAANNQLFLLKLLAEQQLHHSVYNFVQKKAESLVSFVFFFVFVLFCFGLIGTNTPSQ